MMSHFSLTQSRAFQWFGILIALLILGSAYLFYTRSRAAQTVTDTAPTFEAPLTHSLDLTRGIGGPTFTRSDGADRRATVTDFEGLIRPVKNGEARFQGARRVENLLANSDTWGSWTADSVTVTTGQIDPFGSTRAALLTPSGSAAFYQSYTSPGNSATMVHSVWLRSATGSNVTMSMVLNGSGANPNPQTTTFTVTPGWQRFSVTVTTSVSAATVNFRLGNNSTDWVAGENIYIAGAQLEDVTGQANQNPSEYVSVGVKTLTPYHGANVDGVKYFATQNGNTVASNIVTEATGTAIASSTLKGYLAEGSRTNLLTYSEQFDQWSQGGTAVTSTNATAGPDGRTTAETLTDDDGTNYEYVSKSVTVANDSNSYALSIYLKKNVATPAIFAINYGISGGTQVGSNIRVNTGTGASLGSGTVTNFNADWWKVTHTITNNSTGNTSLYVSIFPAAQLVAGGGDTGTATGSSTIWGAQVEQATFASSYIPTTSASVTRAGDVLGYPANSNIGEGVFSAYLEMNRINNSSGSQPNKSPLSIGTYSLNASLNFGGYSGTGGSLLGQFSATALWDLAATPFSAITYGTTHKIALKLKTDLQTFVGYRDGTQSSDMVSEYAKSANWAGSPSYIYIASTESSDPNQNITVKNVRIWQKALTDAQLTNMTSTPDAVSASAVQESTNKAPNNTGLVGYWSFEDASGSLATDFSGSGSTGTLAGPTGANNLPQWTDGKYGKALSFDGTDDKVSGGSFTVPTTTTIAGWIKKTASTGQKSFFSNRGGGGVYFGLNGTQVFFYDAGGSPAGVTTGSVQIGQWQHVVAVSDGAVIKLYVNSILIYSGAKLRTSTSGTFGIGWDPSIGTEYWDGSIDEVRVYDRALDQTEISALYQSGIAKINTSQNSQNTSGLVGLWSFNGPDVSGTTAYDRSGTGNNGTMTAGPTVTEGKVGQGLSFDGTDDHVVVTSTPSTTSFSFSAWAKVASNQTGYDRVVDLGSRRGALMVLDGTKTMYAYADVIGQGDVTAGGFVMTAGQWHHFVGVFDYDGLTIKLYADGNLVGTPTAITGTQQSGTDLYIGSENGSQYFLNGLIDEVRLYNDVLTAAEITALYNAGR